VVAFNDAGYVIQPPTRSRPDVLDAIDRLSVKGGTALGRGILTSLGAATGKRIVLNESALENGARQPGIPFVGSAAVVLLSDGDNTAALDPLAIAPIGAQAGVRIFPIGIGSPGGAVVDVDGFQVATALDTQLLRGIASRSGGTYFAAQDADTLRRVYNSINLKLTVAGHKTEVTAIAAGIALIFLLLGAGLSIRWYGRVI
jgi:Ca-activated chloride channel family protein